MSASGFEKRTAVITALGGGTAPKIMLQFGILQERPNILLVNGKQVNPDMV